MTAKAILMLCAAVALIDEKGCRSSAGTRLPEPTAAENARLDEILGKWEQNTAAFHNYCWSFRCWEYDPLFGPRDTFNTYREGIICIAMPDKWYYRVDRKLTYRAPTKTGESPTYDAADESEYEEWSFDGQWISHADFERRQVVRSQITPEAERVLCPVLPFVFGSQFAIGEPLRWLGRIDREDVKRRYDLRLQPSTKDGHLVIRAVPRTCNDLLGIMSTTLILDQRSCLPRVGILHLDEREDRTVYEFIEADSRVPEGEDFFVPQVTVRDGWTVRQHPWPISTVSNPGCQNAEH